MRSLKTIIALCLPLAITSWAQGSNGGAATPLELKCEVNEVPYERPFDVPVKNLATFTLSMTGEEVSIQKDFSSEDAVTGMVGLSRITTGQSDSAFYVGAVLRYDGAETSTFHLLNPELPLPFPGMSVAVLLSKSESRQKYLLHCVPTDLH